MRPLLFAGIVLCACAQATTLVAVWSPQEVLLAADSRVTTEATAADAACKIGQESSSFFALSGLVDDPAAAYHAEALAHEAATAGGSVQQRIHRFLELVREPLVRSVALVQRDAPQQYEYLQQGHPVLQAIFAFVEQGPPTLAVAGYILAPDGSLSPFTKLIAQGNDGRGPRIIYAGQQTNIRAYLHDHPDWYTGMQPGLVRDLVQLEIAHSAGEVGGPVDIVRLTPGGAEWVQRKAECAVRP